LAISPWRRCRNLVRFGVSSCKSIFSTISGWVFCVKAGWWTKLYRVQPRIWGTPKGDGMVGNNWELRRKKKENREAGPGLVKWGIYRKKKFTIHISLFPPSEFILYSMGETTGW
jgi:hypothetical protein